MMLDGVTFEGYMSFRGATFRADARFSGATFEGGAWFPGATFGDDADFRGATFMGTADFHEGTFGTDADRRAITPLFGRISTPTAASSCAWMSTSTSVESFRQA